MVAHLKLFIPINRDLAQCVRGKSGEYGAVGGVIYGC